MSTVGTFKQKSAQNTSIPQPGQAQAQLKSHLVKMNLLSAITEQKIYKGPGVHVYVCMYVCMYPCQPLYWLFHAHIT